MTEGEGAASSPPETPAKAADSPRAQVELDLADFRGELGALRQSKLFWAGLILKVVCGTMFGSHFATRWFAPFVYEFVHGRFANPWEPFFARGETLAFPYGPGMLGLLSVPFLPALAVGFDPSSHLGLFLLRLPLLAADFAILLLLMRWLRVHARDALVAYWLSPMVLYATYIHGQLDLLPTALVCITLFLVFKRRVIAAAVVFGIALATKGHLFVCAPFVLVYLYRQRRPWQTFVLITAMVAGTLYLLPISSPAFRAMVLGSAESKKLWAVAIPYGLPGLSLYLAPAAVAVSLLRFATYRKVNRELLLMFIGALYVALVALVPPQPGWFIWSIPFVAYFGARLSRTGKFALGSLSVAYLGYFFFADPVVFFEAFDPATKGQLASRFGAEFVASHPSLFSTHAASVAWTTLFATTAICGFEMYRKGVRSNAIYAFRDQTFMIGIGGDSGAGKHTISRDLGQLFGAGMTQINGDDDHRWERGHAMWRQYTHLDPRGNLLAAQLEGLASLRRGGDVRKRHYDHDKGKFTDPILLSAKDFVAITGLHPFYMASQRQLLHLKVFVEPKEEIRRNWKVSRDVAKRGYTPEQVLEQMDRRQADSVKFIQPQKRYADLVIRHIELPTSPTAFAIEYDMSSELDPLSLFDVLSQVEGLTVDWVPDESLSRDTLLVRGDLTTEQLKVLATVTVPNLDELVDERLTGFCEGGRGLSQLVLLHVISARLRGIHAAWANT